MKKIILLAVLGFMFLGAKSQNYLYIDTLQTNPIVARTYEFPDDGEYYMVEKNGHTLRFKTILWVKLGNNQLYQVYTKHEFVRFRDTIGSPYRPTYLYLVSDSVQNMVTQDLINKLNE